jgi:hypothetical protein
MKFWKSSKMSPENIYLKERLVELENAEGKLRTLLTREDGTFKNDTFLQNNLISVLKEQTAIRRKLVELKDVRRQKV